jgi:hypothetical protein
VARALVDRREVSEEAIPQYTLEPHISLFEEELKHSDMDNDDIEMPFTHAALTLGNAAGTGSQTTSLSTPHADSPQNTSVEDDTDHDSTTTPDFATFCRSVHEDPTNQLVPFPQEKSAAASAETTSTETTPSSQE